MKITFWLSALVICSAFSLVGGVLFAEDAKQLFEQAERYVGIQTEPPVKEVVVSSNDAALAKEFEDILNGFLSAFNQQVKTYKQKRKIVDELLDPVNLREPSYVSQNHMLMKALVPELRAQSGDMMAVFTNTDQQIKTALQGSDKNMRQPIEQKWREVKVKSIERTLKFMETDAEILKLSLELISFYDEHKGQMSYDETAGELFFNSENLILREDRYLRDIEDLRAIRQKILSGNI